MRLRSFVIAASAAATLVVTPPAHADETPNTAPASPAAAPAVGAVPTVLTPASPPPPAPQRNEYVGVPAPPTSAGTTPFAFYVHPGLEVFAQYALTLTYPSSGSSSWFHEFEVPRVHGSLDGAYGPVRARILLEGVQSASDGSLVGVGGDSVVVRVREAYAAWAPVKGLEASLGVVPTLTIGELDGTWLSRVIAPSEIENAGLASPADLGGTLRYTLPSSYGWVAVGVYNGEGYTSPELNNGKSVEVAGEIHPFPSTAVVPLAAFVSYVGGTEGTDNARSNRLTGGLLWQGARVRAGATYTYAWGVGDDAVQNSTVTDVFVRVEPIHRLLLSARLAYWVRDTSANPTDAITTIWGAAGWRIADPLEFHLAVTRALPTQATNSELAGSDFLELRAVTRVVF